MNIQRKWRVCGVGLPYEHQGETHFLLFGPFRVESLCHCIQTMLDWAWIQTSLDRLFWSISECGCSDLTRPMNHTKGIGFKEQNKHCIYESTVKSVWKYFPTLQFQLSLLFVLKNFSMLCFKGNSGSQQHLCHTDIPVFPKQSACGSVSGNGPLRPRGQNQTARGERPGE